MTDYPAKFFEDGDSIGVEFPDLPGCFSQGDDIEDAKYWAARAVECYFGRGDDESNQTLYNAETDKTVVIPRFKERLGEKLQAKILAAAGVS